MCRTRPSATETAPAHQSRQRGLSYRTGGQTYGTIVTQAVVESVPVVSGHVPIAAHQVVDVIAQSRCIRAIFACAEAELGVGDEVLFRESVSSVYRYITICDCGRTVHSCSCWSVPNAVENTRPPMGLPRPNHCSATRTHTWKP